jgi:RHS repeat-associated protein
MQTSSSTTAFRVCALAYKFTGKERDTESGLDYFGARYYGSNMGRFMSPDPSGLYYADPTNPQSLNLYSYALNNPLKNIDPTGMYCIYYGDTDENMDGAEIDVDVDQATCEGKGPEGGGKWVDGDNTTVNVNADGSGDVSTDYTSLNSDLTVADFQTVYTFWIAPSKCPGCSVPNQTPQQCATDIANHWSIAGLLPGAPGTGDSFGGGFVAGLLGNNVTGVTSLYNVIFHGDNPVPFAGTVASAGPALGTMTSSAPVGAQGPVAATLGQIAPKAVGEFLDAAFLPKWILDGAIYGEALSYCKTGKY